MCVCVCGGGGGGAERDVHVHLQRERDTCTLHLHTQGHMQTNVYMMREILRKTKGGDKEMDSDVNVPRQNTKRDTYQCIHRDREVQRERETNMYISMNPLRHMHTNMYMNYNN